MESSIHLHFPTRTQEIQNLVDPIELELSSRLKMMSNAKGGKAKTMMSDANGDLGY